MESKEKETMMKYQLNQHERAGLIRHTERISAAYTKLEWAVEDYNSKSNDLFEQIVGCEKNSYQHVLEQASVALTELHNKYEALTGHHELETVSGWVSLFHSYSECVMHDHCLDDIMHLEIECEADDMSNYLDVEELKMPEDYDEEVPDDEEKLSACDMRRLLAEIYRVAKADTHTNTASSVVRMIPKRIRDVA